MQDDLIKRLEALHVWPQFVADDHADILSPRQSAGLYEVGNVAHEAASAGRADNARIAALEADKARLMGLVKEAGEALGDMESRVEMASEWIHNSQDWKVDEYEPGLKIWDWLFRDTRATFAKIKETPDA